MKPTGEIAVSARTFLRSFSTSAGIHADGILKNEEIYNIFNTSKILNRPVSVSVNDKSGLAGIAQWINSHFSLTGKDRVEKTHPGVAKVNRWVTKQYEDGRTTAISDQEMEKSARKYLPEIFTSEFDILKAKAHAMAGHIIDRIIEESSMKSSAGYPTFPSPFRSRSWPGCWTSSELKI